jgi:hypothetical protein
VQRDDARRQLAVGAILTGLGVALTVAVALLVPSARGDEVTSRFSRTATTCAPNPDGSHPPCPPPDAPQPVAHTCNGVEVFSPLPCPAPPPSPAAEPVIAPPGYVPTFAG